MDYIQGERFINLANNVDIFYRPTHEVNAFFRNLKTKTNFVLISHNSDGCIMDSPKRRDSADSKLIPPNLMAWYGQNVAIRHPKIKSLPIGIENNKWLKKVDKKAKMNWRVGQPRKVRNLVYMNFNIRTNPNERFRVRQLFKDKPWVTTNDRVSFGEYINKVYNHMFVLCPEGNGIDTVRTWETLYMGGIPIEKRNVNNMFYTDLPICFVDDWGSITADFLEREYIRIKTSSWNMDKLNFEYWKNKILNSCV